MNNIEKILEKANRDLYNYGLNKKTLSIALISLEEILYLYKNISKNIETKTIRNEKELYIKIDISGSNISPFELEAKNNIFILDNIIKNTNFTIKHEYQNDTNIILLSIERYLPFFENIKFVFSFLKNKTQLFGGYIFNILASIANICIPIFTGKIITEYTNNQLLQIFYTCISLLIIQILYATFFSFASIYYNKVSFYLYSNIQTELIRKLLTVSDNVIERTNAGTFLTRINQDTSVVSQLPLFFNLLSNATYYIGVFIASLVLCPTVFIAEIITFLILFFLEKNRMYYFNIDKRKAISASDIHAGILLDLINGLSDIKILNSTKYFEEKMKKSATNVATLNDYAKTNTTKKTRTNRIITHICYFLIMLYLGYAIHTEKMPIPTAIILFNYFSIINESLVVLIQNFLDYKREFSLSSERIIALIKGNDFQKEINGEIKLNNCKGEIEFDNVSLAYEDITGTGTKIVNNINLKIEKNTTVAFVGKSGSGKTSILKLISAQKECIEGCVKIDGIDIQKIEKESLRNNITMVSQYPSFFNMSIKENLLLAKPDATIDELKIACEKACILKDIENTKDGFDTLLNEKGARFSGGQKQRLAIARIFLKNAKIIIFDEATSSLDNITQKQIMKNIQELKSNHTIIIVAHRLSTIINADKIFVISDGKIIGYGNHNELIKNCAEYKNLYII